MTPARVRLMVALVFLAAAGLALLATTIEWVSFTLSDGERHVVSGADAASAVTALGLALLALAGTLFLVGRIGAVILGVVGIAAGGALGAVAIRVVADPVAVIIARVAEFTGITGDATTDLIAVVDVGIGPYVALGAAALGVVGGVLAIIVARRWPARTSKYERVKDDADANPWDALDAGNDPTGDR